MDETEFGAWEALAAGMRQTGSMFAVFEGPEHRVRAATPAMSGLVGDRPWRDLPTREALPELAGQGLADLMDRVRDSGQPFEAHGWRVALDLPGVGRREAFVDFLLTPWLADDGSVRGVCAEGIDATAEVEARRAAGQTGELSERRHRGARDLVLTLQDTLLPPALPVVPGLQTSGRYLLAEQDTAVGGDWLDVVPLGDGRLALVVGDVVGHGVSASATMGQLRAVLDERLAAGAGVQAALEALEAYVARVPKARATTVAVVELDPATGRMTYCTAGHPPPLLVSADDARYLAPSGARPLGTGGDFTVREDTLGPDELLLLHSDGILERPGVEPAPATVKLAAAARRIFRGEAFRRDDAPVVDWMCEDTMEILIRETGHSDDVTLLAAQRVPAPRDLAVLLQAEPGAPARARELLSGWLADFGLDVVDELALHHAVGECVANVVDHAYVDLPDEDDRPLRVTACLEPDGTAVVGVVDRGRWRRKSPGDRRGRGLQMVDALAREVRVDRSERGTSVTLRFALARPVVLLDSSPSSGHLPTTGQGVAGEHTLVEQGGGVLTARGVFDADTAGELRTGLLRLEGRHDGVATVDLTGATVLASAAVRVLFEAVERAAARGVELRLVSTPGSVAHRVLELVGLPHEPDGGPDDLPPL